MAELEPSPPFLVDHYPQSEPTYVRSGSQGIGRRHARDRREETFDLMILGSV
jgi:hypothetical protein